MVLVFKDTQHLGEPWAFSAVLPENITGRKFSRILETYWRTFYKINLVILTSTTFLRGYQLMFDF